MMLVVGWFRRVRQRLLLTEPSWVGPSHESDSSSDGAGAGFLCELGCRTSGYQCGNVGIIGFQVDVSLVDAPSEPGCFSSCRGDSQRFLSGAPGRYVGDGWFGQG